MSNASPIPAFGVELDLRRFSGATLFQRDPPGTSTTASILCPTWTATQGTFPDWLDFLHGRGSQTGWSWTEQLQDSIGTSTVITVTINDEDKIEITSSLVDFTIEADNGSTDNAFYGFSPAGHGLVGGAAPYIRTAPNTWTRGLIDRKFIRMDFAGAPPVLSTPDKNKVQNVVTLVRSLGNESDMDDAYSGLTLEDKDNAAFDAASVLSPNSSIRWFVTDDGRIGWSAPTTFTAGASITIIDEDFFRLLGWNGNETVQTEGLYDYQIGTYPAACFMVPSRPIEKLTRERIQVDSASRQKDGAIAGVKMGSYEQLSIEFWLDGPADEEDLHRHWLDKVVPYLQRGRRVNFYMEWGESRRCLDDFNVAFSQPAYDLLYTNELHGERGRYTGRVGLASPGSMVVNWPNRLRRRAPVTLRLERTEDYATGGTDGGDGIGRA